MRILLIEDEHLLGDAVRERVARDGHAVDWVKRIDDGNAAVAAVNYDVILLDLYLPDGRGLDLLQLLRSGGSRVPVLILTARDQIRDRIEGLNEGADDYLVKPFDLDELSARIKAVARRAAGDPSRTVAVGDLEIDRVAPRLLREGKLINLTAREWALLLKLTERVGAIASKRQLEDALYAFGDEVESNALEAHISRLRKKIGRNAIRTIRGLGYQMGGE